MASRPESDVAAELTAALGDVTFPTTKGQLLDVAGERTVGGTALTVADLLMGLHDKTQLHRREDAVAAALAQWRELTG